MRYINCLREFLRRRSIESITKSKRVSAFIQNESPSNEPNGAYIKLVGKHYVRTHCKRGHEFTEDNIYRVSGKKSCRTCRAEYAKNYERKWRKAA